MSSHRDLAAWQACRLLIAKIYKATEKFPASERYGLTSQLRRAAISAAANIAEGHGRWGPRETAHGASISLGSLAEIDALFAASEDLGYLPLEELADLEALRFRAAQLTYALHRSLRAASR